MSDPNDSIQSGQSVDTAANTLAGSPGLSSWITGELVEETQTAWEPIYGHPVSQDEAIEIIQTFSRLVDMLGET